MTVLGASSFGWRTVAPGLNYTWRHGQTLGQRRLAQSLFHLRASGDEPQVRSPELSGRAEGCSHGLLDRSAPKEPSDDAGWLAAKTEKASWLSP